MSWIVIPFVLYFIALLWATHDAYEHTGYGCAWAWIFLLTGPIGMGVYLVLRLSTSRPDRSIVPHANPLADNISRFPTEIEKARFIEAAGKGGGTMFDPEEGQSEIPGGFPHFSDPKAEALIRQRRFEEAWDYLIDLYSMARRDQNGRAEDTYRHYLYKLPGGIKRFQEWRTENENIRVDSKPPARRDVPF